MNQINEKIARKEMKMDLITYSIMINTYSKLKQPDEAERMLHEMINYDLKPDLICYSTVINAFSQANLPNKAEKLLLEI